MAKAAEHFAFGKNWASYAAKVTEAELAEAERGLFACSDPRVSQPSGSCPVSWCSWR
jgi:hypothetical protein